MNRQKALEILNSQSPTGRKVSLLVAFVNERGPQPESALVNLGKAHKPLRLAVKMDYLVLTPDGKYSLGWQAQSLLHWLLGMAGKPKSWDKLEEEAGVRKLLRAKRKGLL